jgi:hypothetical protein
VLKYETQTDRQFQQSQIERNLLQLQWGMLWEERERERVQRDGGRWGGGRLWGAACYLGTPHTHPATHRSAPKGAAGAAAAMAIGREERAVWKMEVTCNKQKRNKTGLSRIHITLWPVSSFKKWQVK